MPPTPFYLTSLSLRYIPSLCMHFYCRAFPCAFSFFFFLKFFLYYYFFIFRLNPSPFLFINPQVGKFSTVMGTPMEGFFDGVDIVVEAMASVSIAAQGAPTEAPIPPPKPVLVEESAYAKRVGESAPIPADTPTL